ncbi:MAG: diaminopimelate decarboxylase [Sulfuricellaceae bacterium]
MNPFEYRNGELYAESVRLRDIADAHGSPTYIYSRAALSAAYRAYDQAFGEHPHLVCYAVKANSNLAVLNVFARLGAGFDIVSGGELQRVLAAGGEAGKVVFSGVGKSDAEIRLALEKGILCFNVESESELHHLNRIAGEMGKTAPVSLRVNPNVDPKTHPYISTGLKNSKFGIAYDQARRVYRLAAELPNLAVRGIDCHIGSQITELGPFADAVERVLTLVESLEADGIEFHHLDFGGGVGIRYTDETPPSAQDYVKTLLSGLSGRGQQVLIEPGRSLVGNAGLLLTRVQYLKHGEARNFAVVDAAMNDLARPALYDAWHDILPVMPRGEETPEYEYEIVGPVCESGDFLGHDRRLSLMEGDLLAVMSAGAYGMSMSSNYNTRPRAAEVMVDGDIVHLARQRETVELLYALERPLP